MEIDKEIIQKATKCDKQFACLNNKQHACCEIFKRFNNEICMIYKANNHTCNYKESGFSDVCTCPVRVEIYNKYKK
jgi:hypothetical protein